jgi:hypothetical protein
MADAWANWDRTAGLLESIEANASWIEEHAARIESAVRLLKEKPPFETRAEDGLKKSAERLQLTLQLVRSAMQTYEATPFMQAAE